MAPILKKTTTSEKDMRTLMSELLALDYNGLGLYEHPSFTVLVTVTDERGERANVMQGLGYRRSQDTLFTVYVFDRSNPDHLLNLEDFTSHLSRISPVRLATDLRDPQIERRRTRKSPSLTSLREDY